MLDTNTNTNASTFAIAKTAHFLYEVETTEEIRARLTRLSRHEQAGSLQVLDNGAGVSKNGKAKKYFSFFMPTDEGNKLIAQFISYEGLGNVFIDFQSKTKYVDNATLMPQARDVVLADVLSILGE